jgi:hypothetical protein
MPAPRPVHPARVRTDKAQGTGDDMRGLFNVVMRIVSSLLGVLMVAMGTIWICQGLGIAFLTGFMANNRQWAIYGAILFLFGIGQVVWSNTRRH